MGNPLSEEDQEYMISPNGGSPTKETNYPQVDTFKEYAYWGQDKYFQQKAVVDRYDTGEQRISYTDYYPNTATAGSKGQTYKTYSDPYTKWTGILPPAAGWQASVAPDTSNYDAYTSITAYNSAGQATDIKKMQTETGTDPNISLTYTETSTAYYASGAPDWGEPQSVTEDVGGVGRVTQTLAYDSSGHATSTEDAAGHIFNTTYQDPDYQVSNISENDSTYTGPVVTYNYDESGTPPAGTVNDNGQVKSVTDNLSGAEDKFVYDDTPGDGGLGQVQSTQELGGNGPSYSVAYVYTTKGDRGTTTYTTASGTTAWQYDDYCSVGKPSASSCPRVPQTMRLLDSSNNPTSEEFHYQYDGSGALLASGFAQTPASGYSPGSGNPYYTPTELPSTRARVIYDNGSGVNNGLYYYWDTWNAGAYSSQSITGFQYGYDPISLLKIGAVFLNPDSTGMSWVTGHTEAYAYVPDLDYLASANYNSSGNGTKETWTYDAAGNRLSDSATGTSQWTYDGLNRLQTSPGYVYSNDILGNRLSNSAGSETWDQLNRMVTYTDGGSHTTNYSYRSDGLRVQKIASTTTTSFAYDGQMGFEDTVTGGSNPGATDYAIGPRGIERSTFTSGGATSAGSYPIYDGHGNMVAGLSENAGSYSTGNYRSYDAWGNIIGGAGSGDPSGRYCANLGHKQDDESGLLYMRARYEDPLTGRFISSDRTHNGSNWFEYALNNPLNDFDASGNEPSSWNVAFWGFIIGLGLGMLYDFIAEGELVPPNVKDIVTGVLGAIIGGFKIPDRLAGLSAKWLQPVVDALKSMWTEMSEEDQIAAVAITACAIEAGVIAGMLLSMEADYDDD